MAENAAVRGKKRADNGRPGDGRMLQTESVLAASGRTYPHNLEAEEGLLASCLLEGPDVISRCQESGLRAEAFYSPAHQLIFECLCTIFERRKAVDEIILADELRTRGALEDIGGLAFINQLTNRVQTAAHAQHFIDIVKEKFLLRRLIRSSTHTVERCFQMQGSLDQFLEEVEQEIFRISEDRISDSAKSIKESVKEAYTVMEKLFERKGESGGVPSGFTDLDKLTYGFHPQDMIVLAARPSMGKTSLALNFAEAAALPKGGDPDRVPHTALIFSLEMSSQQLAMRVLCSRARVSLVRLRDGLTTRQDKQALVEAADEWSRAPLWIDDSGNLTILELRAKARRIQAQHGLGIVLVDYLQLLAGTDPSVQREQQISEISRGLKAMAKELNVPVIVLSQLNRESEKERRQPRLSDLRESGAIEQDADVVLLLARPKDAEDDYSVAGNKADLIVAKQRNGPVGTISLTFRKEITRFENYSSHSE